MSRGSWSTTVGIAAPLRLLILLSTLTVLAGAGEAPPVTLDTRGLPPAPEVGEVLRDRNGKLGPAFQEQMICSPRGCKSYVYDKRTLALVAVDRHVSGAFAFTGDRQEVKRATPYTEAEKQRPAVTTTATPSIPIGPAR